MNFPQEAEVSGEPLRAIHARMRATLGSSALAPRMRSET